jgi:hypothetical protein
LSALIAGVGCPAQLVFYVFNGMNMVKLPGSVHPMLKNAELLYLSLLSSFILLTITKFSKLGVILHKLETPFSTRMKCGRK